MAWKPKEKQLSMEEAIAIAKKELAPLWFGSGPLLAGIRSGSKASAHPLDPKFVQKTWLIAFIDATSFGGEATLDLLQEWYERYHDHALEFLLILHFPYSEVYTRRAVEESLIEERELQYPLAIDLDGSLAAAFGVDHYPKLVLLKDGHPVFEYAGEDLWKKTEAHLQQFLRSTDPGLPLLPVFSPPEAVVRDTGAVEFGDPRQYTEAAALPDTPLADKVLVTGNWKKEPGRLVTSDPKACIALHCPARFLAVIARPLAKSLDPIRIQLTINGISVFEEYHGPQLASDDDGLTSITLSHRWFYQALRNLPLSDRQLVLRFPDAAAAPVAIYGLRFGN